MRPKIAFALLLLTLTMMACQPTQESAEPASTEADVEAITAAPTIAPITLGCALSFMDRILADTDWRADHPGLAAWYESYKDTPHMAATAPAD